MQKREKILQAQVSKKQILLKDDLKKNPCNNENDISNVGIPQPNQHFDIETLL